MYEKREWTDFRFRPKLLHEFGLSNVEIECKDGDLTYSLYDIGGDYKTIYELIF